MCCSSKDVQQQQGGVRGGAMHERVAGAHHRPCSTQRQDGGTRARIEVRRGHKLDRPLPSCHPSLCTRYRAHAPRWEEYTHAERRVHTHAHARTHIDADECTDTHADECHRRSSKWRPMCEPYARYRDPPRTRPRPSPTRGRPLYTASRWALQRGRAARSCRRSSGMPLWSAAGSSASEGGEGCYGVSRGQCA